MKAPVICLVAAAMLAGCGSVPYRYEGSDAATLAGDDNLGWATRTTTMVVELNGQHRGLIHFNHPINVRPGVLKVGVHFTGGGARGGGCFEVDAAPGGYYQFSSIQVEGGFLVSLHEGRAADRRLIGKIFVPLRHRMDMSAYCPKETRS
jgi:hypothetical protein